MFIVFDAEGVGRPYDPKPAAAVRSAMNIKAVSAVRPVNAIESAAVSPDSERRKSPNPYQKLDLEQPIRRLLYARDLMSSPVLSVSAENGIKEIRAVFEDSKLRHVPVLGDRSTIVGILSDRDYYKFVSGRNRLPDNLTARDIMRKDVLTAAPETEIRTLAQVMFEEHIGSLPVVDASQHLTGIITRSDILRGLLKHGPIELWG